MKGSVLDVLTDAYRRAPKHDPRHEPKPSELLAFDPAFDAELLHAYRDRFSALEGAYDRLRRRSEKKATLEPLTKELAEFWKWIVAERGVLRLFQLLRWWRQDHGGPRKGETSASTAAEEVAYLLVAMRLLLVAVQTYEADVRGFTPEESAFIRTPLARAPHHSTYFRLLDQAYTDVPGVLKEVELFLRLHALGEHMGGSLATNEELKRMLVGVLASDPKELASRSFSPGARRQTTFKIGETVDNRVFIVYFDARTRAPIYVNFAHTGGVVFAVPPAKIAALSDQELVHLIYEGTEGMLVLIQLLFEVMAAVPGVVAGGLPALVEACLMPVEAKAAEKVMDALGLDGDKAGWVVLGINILAHRFAPGKASVETTAVEAEEGGWWSKATKARATAETETGSPATEKVTSESAGARPRSAANDNALVDRGASSGKVANENRLLEPTLEELEKHAATAQQAQEIAVEIAELERIQQELVQESEEVAGAAVASAGRRGGRGGAIGSRETTGTSRALGATGTRVSPGTGKGQVTRPRGPTVLDDALCARKGITPEMKKWLEDVAAEWSEQSARFKKEPISESFRGRKRHLATQRAIKKLHPGTFSEEITGVSSSRTQRVSDLEHSPTGPVGELKPWAWKMPDGRLATSREAIESGVETLQIQAYEILDRGVGRPVFVFTAEGNVWTPDPGTPKGWIKIGRPR